MSNPALEQLKKIVDLLTTALREADVMEAMLRSGGEGDQLMDYTIDWPVGMPEERAQHDWLPGAWVDATGYGMRYNATGKWAVHTGKDMNLNTPRFDADAHSPVYAPADGVVKFAGPLPVWANVIVIEHVLADGRHYWSRLAHGENLLVKAGDGVKRGQQVCNVGNADGRYPYHLHFDVATIDIGAKPADWPGDDLARVQRDYRDPGEVIRRQQI